MGPVEHTHSIKNPVTKVDVKIWTKIINVMIGPLGGTLTYPFSHWELSYLDGKHVVLVWWDTSSWEWCIFFCWFKGAVWSSRLGSSLILHGNHFNFSFKLRLMVLEKIQANSKYCSILQLEIKIHILCNCFILLWSSEMWIFKVS